MVMKKGIILENGKMDQQKDKDRYIFQEQCSIQVLFRMENLMEKEK
jgi:hypothetical protein